MDSSPWQTGRHQPWIKSGTTFARDWVDSALRFAALAGATALPPIIVWGGADSFEFLGCRVLSWRG